MKISSRFALDNLFVVGAAFLAVISMTFSTHIAGWTGFGVFAGLAVLAIASLAVSHHNTGRRIGHALLAIAALWALSATLAFSGNIQMWLLFADAVGLGVLALGDLTAHEVTTENVVHRFEITQPMPANGRISTGTAA